TGSWTSPRSAGTAPGWTAPSPASPPPRWSTSRPAADPPFPPSSWSRDEAAVAHAGHRGRVPDHRPAHAGAHLLHHRDPAGGFGGAGRGEARAAPVDGGGGELDLPLAGGSAPGAGAAAPAGDGARRAARPRDRGRGDAPVLVVDRAGGHAAPALHRRQGGPAGAG